MTIYDQLSKAVAEATPREVQPRVSSPSHQPTQGHRVRDAVIIGVVVGVDVEVGDGVDDDDHHHHHYHHRLLRHHRHHHQKPANPRSPSTRGCRLRKDTLISERLGKSLTSKCRTILVYYYHLMLNLIRHKHGKQIS